MRRWVRFSALITAAALFLPLLFVLPAEASDTEAGLSAGSYHAMELKSDGTLWAWGTNQYGQLGDGTTSRRTVPFRVMDGVKQAAAGRWCSYAVTTDGTLYAWGSGEQGQLGLGDTKNRLSPTKVMGGVTQVAAALNRAYALTGGGTLYAWGNANFTYPDGERLGSTPRQVAANVDRVFCGGSTTLILRDGVLYALGGAVGGGEAEVRIAASVTTAAATSSEIFYIDMSGRLFRYSDGGTKLLLSEMASVAADGGRYAAISRAGTLYTWGANASGELGQGHYSKVNSPAIALHDVQSVTVGTGFIAAVKRNGELWTCGSNNYYQLGSGSDRTNYNTFHQVREGATPSKELGYGEYRVVLDGERMSFDVPPREQSGRLLVPMRAIFEALGAKVDWIAATNTATAAKDGHTVSVTIGSTTAYVDGSPVELDVPAVEINWRTLLPLRFVATALGAEVDYFGGERLCEIRSSGGAEAFSADAAAAQSAAISVELTGGGVGSASGVVVHPRGLVLTNRHVVENAKKITVRLNGIDYAGQVAAMSDSGDAAIVKIDAAGLHAAEPPSRAAAEGDALTVYDGSTGRTVAGKVTLAGYDGSSLLMDAKLLPGASGSGAYDSRGRLVGLVWASVGTNRAAVLPWSEFADIIAEAVEKCGF